MLSIPIWIPTSTTYMTSPQKVDLIPDFIGGFKRMALPVNVGSFSFFSLAMDALSCSTYQNRRCYSNKPPILWDNYLSFRSLFPTTELNQPNGIVHKNRHISSRWPAFIASGRLTMQHVSAEDFQIYHDPAAIKNPDSTLHKADPLAAENLKDGRPCFQHHDLPIHSIEGYTDDGDHNDSLSGSARHSSGADDLFFDKSSGHSSPQTSHHSDDCMSELLSESRRASCKLDPRPSSPYTPLKHRSPFRNPSSVRAMQMETTPPPFLPSPHSPLQHKRPVPSRSATPRSTHSQHGAMRTPSRLSPGKKVKKEYPLVLLHVTLLPANVAYSTEVMETVLPCDVLENWKLLRDALTDTVLERGILIPHPKEDYGLLEERLLESLELKLPRILKCGHLHIEPDDSPEGSDVEDDGSDMDDADVCVDCGRHIRDGRFGSTGEGKRRWDIKIFAANGLMRAAAWGAAWREMERVDVEILPWMDEKMRRELEMRQDEEDRLQQGNARGSRGERAEGGDDDVPRENAGDGRGEGGLDEQRRREIYGNDAQAYVDGLYDEPPAKKARAVSRSRAHRGPDVPLLTLVQNYLMLLARDRRNIATFLLALLVVFFANRPPPTDAVARTLGKVAHTPILPSVTDRLSSAVTSSTTPSAETIGFPEPMASFSTNSDDGEAEAEFSSNGGAT